MKLANIVPTVNLEQIGSFGFHMALAPRLAEDTEYRELYRLMGSHGASIMVDNGAAEEIDMDFKEVLRLTAHIHADYVVLPDVLYNAEETMDLFMRWWQQVPVYMIVAVPQGKTYEDWVQCAVQMLTKPGLFHVAVNRATIKFGVGRRKAIKRILSFGYRPRFHVMGIQNNPYEEIKSVRGLPGVYSLDTGCAAAYAQRNLRLGEFTQHYSLDHDKPCEPELLEENISLLWRWCHGAKKA